MPQVPAVATPLSLGAQGVALVGSLALKFGRDPSLGLAELCLAQLGLENAKGKALWNDNPGNVTTGDTSQHFYILSKLHTDAMGKILSEGDPGAVVLRFRSYDTPLQGMGAYVDEIARRPSMVKAGDAGDARAFALAIKDSGYTPGISVEPVAKSLDALASEIRAAHYLDVFGLQGEPAHLGAPPISSMPGMPGLLLPALGGPVVLPVGSALVGSMVVLLAAAGLYVANRYGFLDAS